MWFKDCHHENKNRQHSETDKDSNISPAQGIERQLAPSKLHMVCATYNGTDIEQAYSKSIHLDTTSRWLWSTSYPHQNCIDDDALNAQISKIYADKACRSRTDSIEKSLSKFFFQTHAVESIVPLKKTYWNTADENKDGRCTKHNLRVHVI